MLFDWVRLNHQTQSPEEHEMGPAFGLGHVCAIGATQNTPTNIMASQDCGKGSGGLRTLGFNRSQIATIERNARLILRRFQKANEPQGTVFQVN